jgi:hypothetical protein
MLKMGVGYYSNQIIFVFLNEGMKKIQKYYLKNID